MYLAYSALRNDDSTATATTNPGKPVNRKLRLRYRGYQAACQKYEQEIAAIQQYLPDWQPVFK